MPGLASAGAAIIPSLFSIFSGISQKRQANKINPINPGYQMNNQVIDNARKLGDRSSNFTLPGYGEILNNIDQTYSGAFEGGVQGASSGGDVIDLATKIAYGKNNAINQLGIQTATAKDAAFKDYLSADALAGEQYQGMNAYQRQQYDAKLKEKAAKEQAGMENIYSGVNGVAQVATSALNPSPLGKDPGGASSGVNWTKILQSAGGIGAFG